MKKPVTAKQICTRLLRVAQAMEKLGCDMEFSGKNTEIADHGHELMGAAHIARTWVKGIREEEAKK